MLSARSTRATLAQRSHSTVAPCASRRAEAASARPTGRVAVHEKELVHTRVLAERHSNDHRPRAGCRAASRTRRSVDLPGAPGHHGGGAAEPVTRSAGALRRALVCRTHRSRSALLLRGG